MPPASEPDKAMKPPAGLLKSGKELWATILQDFELDPHEELLLLQACRCADNLDRLATESRGKPVTVANGKGDQVTRPSITEHRQQAITLSRLLASLRLPSGDEAEQRPQRRGAARGSYGPRPVSLHSAGAS